MIRLLFLLFIFIFLIDLLYGQPAVKENCDKAYIKDLSDELSVRLYGVNKFNKFRIYNNDSEHSLCYSPNSNLNLGVGVNYKWIGLGLAFNFPFVNNDDDIYGKTKRFDAQTNIFTRRLAIDVYLQYYQGFYIENPDSYQNDWTEGMPYPQRPDIVTATIGGSCIYAFNYKKYSAKAAFVQTELQKKSAGSFLLGGFFSLFGITGDSSLIPYELKEVYSPDLFFKHVSVTGIGVAFGYSHTFVMWKKLYLSLTLVPGIYVQNYSAQYEDDQEQETGTFISGRFLGRMALVYNSEKSYAGITAINDSFSGNTGEGQKNRLHIEVGVVRIFYGRRFSIK